MVIARPRALGDVIVLGAVGGIVAGAVFILGEMILAAILGMPFVAPLQMIGSIVLGPAALVPTYPLATAILTGLVVHAVLSAIFGALFTFVLSVAGQLDVSYGLLLLYGAVYGFLLWLVNFQVIAPALFPQFTLVDQFWLGVVPHVLLFGLPLGWYTAGVVRRTAI